MTKHFVIAVILIFIWADQSLGGLPPSPPDHHKKSQCLAQLSPPAQAQLDHSNIWPQSRWNGNVGFLFDTTLRRQLPTVIRISDDAAEALHLHKYPVRFRYFQIQNLTTGERLNLNGTGEESLNIYIENGELVLFQDSRPANGDPKVQFIRVKPRQSHREFSGALDPSTIAIQDLTQIDGFELEKLEKKMRSTTGNPYGPLGQNESLLDVLASDNEFVLRQGLVHADFAQILNEIYFLSMAHGDGSFSTHVAGTQYTITVTSGEDMRITNSSNGVSILVRESLLHWIGKYGFYEGFGSHYRVSPEELLMVFPHLKKLNEEVDVAASR